MSDSEVEHEVFENITDQMKTKFVTRKRYNTKVYQMKEELEKRNEHFQKMEIFKLYERERLKNKIIEAEKKVLGSKLTEIELKLKLKTQKYDELLKWKNSGNNPIEKVSFGTQTAIEESRPAIETITGRMSPATTTTTTTAAGEMTGKATSTKARTKRKQLDLVEPRRSKRKAKFVIQKL